MTRKIFWKKSLDQLEPEDFSGMKLRRVLGVMGLLLMGIRVIIGTGIFILKYCGCKLLWNCFNTVFRPGRYLTVRSLPYATPNLHPWYP
jgi:hypothetical protein